MNLHAGIGKSVPFMASVEQLENLGAGLSSGIMSAVTIEGETGTGKDLAAGALDEAVRGTGRPMLAVNLAELPESLIESTLFGVTRGAYTDAKEDRTGLLELAVAERRLLFLDDLDDLPYHLQPKLLNALERGVVRRLGSTTDISIAGLRVIAAGRCLDRAVTAGRFRQDLLQRLRQGCCRLPTLAERGEEDRRLLLAHYLGAVAPTLHEAPLDRLLAFSFPGNVRQLVNVARTLRAFALRHPGESIPPLALVGCLPREGAIARVCRLLASIARAVAGHGWAPAPISLAAPQEQTVVVAAAAGAPTAPTTAGPACGLPPAGAVPPAADVAALLAAFSECRTSRDKDRHARFARAVAPLTSRRHRLRALCEAAGRPASTAYKWVRRGGP